MTMIPVFAVQSRTPTTPVYQPPAVVSSTAAVYPINSIASGTVVLEVNLDKTGAVGRVRVIHEIPSLTEPAITSVKKWKFSPAKLDGEPIAPTMAVAFSFVPPNTGPRF